MRWWWRLGVMGWIAAGAAFGDVCWPPPEEHVCSFIQRYPAAFRVKVVAVREEVALARVDEVFWGWGAEKRFVAFRASGRLPGKDYLVLDEAKATVASEGLPVPREWGDPKHLPFVIEIERACWRGTVRQVDWSTDDLDYLRRFVKIGAWIGYAIRGTVHYVGESSDRAGEPAAGVRVEITSGEERWERTTDDHGRYRVDRMARGPYEVRVIPGRLKKALEFGTRGVLGYSTCELPWTLLSTGAFVRGRVYQPDGRPANVTPNLGVVQADGSVKGVKVDGKVDSAGGYEIGPVPPGRFVVEVNSGQVPSRSVPWKPSRTAPFEIGIGQVVRGIDLKLGKVVPFGRLYVELFWPDGTPARDSVHAVAVTETDDRFRVDSQGAPEGSNRVGLFVPLRASLPDPGRLGGQRRDAS